jgi:UDP:flavonoid glycosyltransferase YjiC (YdhE family)
VRVLITVSPWPSHFFPTVPLAWALMAAGHQVRVACQPSLAPTVERAGLTVVVTGKDVDMAQLARRDAQSGPQITPTIAGWRATPDANVVKVLRRFVTTSEAMAHDTIEFTREWCPDLIVYEPVGYAGLLAADLFGLPVVRHMWGGDAVYPYRHVEPEVLAPLWRRFGMTAARAEPDLMVDPCPGPLRAAGDARDRQPIRYIAYNGPATLPDWLRRPPDRPRVAITCGTSLPSIINSLSFTENAIRASVDLGLDVVVTIAPSQRALLGELPPNIRTVEFLPLHLLLPSCTAIVHQGGAGTTLTAASLGVQQLVLPALGDQYLNAQQVSTAGVGTYVDTPLVTSRTIGDALNALLTDTTYHTTAVRLATEMAAQPAPAEVAATLAGRFSGAALHSSDVRAASGTVHQAEDTSATTAMARRDRGPSPDDRTHPNQEDHMPNVAAPPDTDSANRLRQMIMGYVASQLVRAAAQLKIADHLAEGPRTNVELTETLGANEDGLKRFLRACVVFGLVEEIDREKFQLTPLGSALAADNGRLASVAIAMAGPNVARPCEHFAEVVMTGKSATKQSVGYEFWDYYDHHAEEAKHYAESMSHLSAHCADGLAEVYDLSRHKTILDVGGGHGLLISGMLRHAPDSNGIVYDRAEVTERATGLIAERELTGRVKLATGNFLEEVPSGADLYTIKSVICDWDDEHAGRILANIHKAAQPGTPLLVIDWMLPDEPHLKDGFTAGPAAGLPITNFGLMVATNGKVRTRSEFRRLIESAGFTVDDITAFSDGLTEWHLIKATA